MDHGIFHVSSPENSCLCYTRTLSGLERNLQDHLASRYIDVLPNGALDVESQTFLRRLKHEKLPQVLKTSSNYRAYSIPWMPGGISHEVTEHKNYLSQLCEQVYVDVKRLINSALTNQTNLSSPLHSEVLHHAALCTTKCESYCDRRDGILSRIQDHILKPATNPLVIHGRSGSGKTSVMAKAASCMQEWCTGFVVVRFLGTSPQSSTIREVLVSISEQICTLFGFSLPLFSKMETIDIVQYFRNVLMSSIEKIPSKRVVIMLDSIDQLSLVDGAHSMKWLPLFLPPNVHIVISMLPDQCTCLESMHALLPPSAGECYVQLGSLCTEAGMEIMDLWLSNIGRSITTKQRELVEKAFISCPQPLFLKLIFDQARTWQSYLDEDHLFVSSSVQEAFLHFYTNLEVQFGQVLVEKSLGYFTAAKGGLTESELEHVLSLDDEVLNDIYQYWDPPAKGVLRIPSLLWKRIRHAIADYIVEQKADGMTVLTWYHRQFAESASSRYVQGGATKESLHLMLSQFFEGTWGGGTGKSIDLQHRSLFLKDASRQVPAQPLKFSDSVYNYRKLSEYPYHLLHSKQIDQLKSEVLSSFTWIHTKLKAVGFTGTVRDYLSALEVFENESDVSVVCETLSLSGSNLKKDPDFLAGQLLGRLLTIPPSSSISQLLNEAEKWVQEAGACVFQPLNSCLISPGGELKVTVAGHPQVVLGVEKSESLPFLVSYSRGPGCSIFNVWDLTSLQCIENVSTLKLQGDRFLPEFNHVLSSSHLVAINIHSCAVWNIRTGECIKHVKNFEGRELSCVAATHDCECILVGTSQGHVYFADRFLSLQEHKALIFEEGVKSIHITPDDKSSLILSGCDSIAVVNVQDQIIKNSISYDTSNFTVVHIAECRDGTVCVVAGTTSGTVCFSEFPDLSFTVSYGHSKAVKCITHISSLNLAVTGSLDKTMCVWDLHECSIIRRLEGHVDGVWCLDFIPNSSQIVSGSKDDYLKVWDILSGECLHKLEGHSSWISSVKAISANAVVSGSNDKTLKFWNLDAVRPGNFSSDTHLAHPESIAFGPHGLAASGGPDAVKVWDPSNGSCLFSQPTPTSCVAFDTNRGVLMAGSASGAITIYSVLDFSQVKILESHTGKVTGLEPLDEGSGNLLVSSSLDSTLIVWSECHERTILHSGNRVGAGVTIIIISLDRKLLASGSQDGSIHVWDLSLLSCSGSLNGHSKTIDCCAFNADHTRLVSGSDDRTARVWDIHDMSCLSVVTYTDSVKALCFTSPDVFVAGVHRGNDQLKAWNAETGDCLMSYVGHTHAVMCMLLVDGDTIATSSRDGTVRLWRIKTSEMLASFDLQSQIKHIALSKTPTGQYLLAATTKSGPVAFLKFRISVAH